MVLHGGKRRQQTPRTARPHHIEDAVDDLAHWPSPWSTRAIRRWQMRFDHTPFLIGRVCLVSVRLADMLHSSGWGPHGVSGVGLSNPLESRRSQPLNPFRNGLLGWFVGDDEEATVFLRCSEGCKWHKTAFAAAHHLGRDWSEADKGRFWRSIARARLTHATITERNCCAAGLVFTRSQIAQSFVRSTIIDLDQYAPSKPGSKILAR